MLEEKASQTEMNYRKYLNCYPPLKLPEKCELINLQQPSSSRAKPNQPDMNSRQATNINTKHHGKEETETSNLPKIVYN